MCSLSTAPSSVRSPPLPASRPKQRNLRTVLGAFGFSGDAVDRKIEMLSGGERTRLALAICMVNPVNLLVLDEPTNHLDLPSCDVLEDALVAYPGTVLLVSHDRHLIRAVADDLLEIRDGTVRLHHGVDEGVLTPSFEGGKVGPTSDRAQGKSIRGAKKRADAEARQARYAATKDLKADVSRLERELAAAEREVAELDRRLADPDLYEKNDEVAEIAKRFGVAKDAAAALMDEWERAATRLEEAERSN